MSTANSQNDLCAFEVIKATVYHTPKISNTHSYQLADINSRNVDSTFHRDTVIWWVLCSRISILISYIRPCQDGGGGGRGGGAEGSGIPIYPIFPHKIPVYLKIV